MNRNSAVALWLFVVGMLVVVMAALGSWIRQVPAEPFLRPVCTAVRIWPPWSRDAWQHALESDPQSHAAGDAPALSPSELRRYCALWRARKMVGAGLCLVYFGPLLLFYRNGAILRHRLPAFSAAGFLVLLHSGSLWFKTHTGVTTPIHAAQLRSAFHFVSALGLLAVSLWMAYGYFYGQPDPTQPRTSASLRRASVLFVILHALQMTSGNLMASLRAGSVADSFPFMLGRLIPPGIWSYYPSVWNPLANPLMVHFQHRWSGFVVLLAAWVQVRRSRMELVPGCLGATATATAYLILAQIALGIALVTLDVPAWLSSVHLLTAMIILATGLLSCHRAFRA